MTLSVLICTYNRPKLLGRSLEALITNTHPKPDQVVVVNGGGREADEIVNRFIGRGISVELIKTINKNLAASRNAGLPACKGDIIAMTDDDAEVFPDWVARMKEAHALHPEAGAVGGPVLGADRERLIDKMADVVTFPSWPDSRAVRTLPGVNISYKREVVMRLGPQDESLFRGEDVDYNWRLQKLGYTVHYDPVIKVRHHHRPDLRSFLRQHYMYGRAYYLVRNLHPDMYCVYPRRFKTLTDWLKAINFLAGLAYDPLLTAAKLASWKDRLAAWPVFLGIGLAWKGGMLVQLIKTNFSLFNGQNVQHVMKQ